MNLYIKNALFFIVSMVLVQPAYGMARILGLYKHSKMRSSITRMPMAKELSFSSSPTALDKSFDFKKNQYNWNQSTSGQHPFNKENGKALWLSSWATILSLFGLSSWISCQDQDEEKQSNVTNSIVKKLIETKANPEKLNALAHEIVALKKEGKIVNVNALVEVIKKEFFHHNQLTTQESGLINFFKIIAQDKEIKQELVETSEILFKTNQYSLLPILGSATHDIGINLAHLIANQPLHADSLNLFQKIIKAHSAEIASFTESIETMLNQPFSLQDYDVADDYFHTKNNFSSFLNELIQHYSQNRTINTVLKNRFNALEQKIDSLFAGYSANPINENDYTIIEALSKKSDFRASLQSLCSTLMTKAIKCDASAFEQMFAAEQQGSLIPFISLGLQHTLIKPYELSALFNKLIDNAHSFTYLTSIKNYPALSTAWNTYLLDHFETIMQKAPLLYGEIDDVSVMQQCLEKLSSSNLHKSENGLIVLKRCLALAQINEQFNQTFVSWIIKHAAELNPIVVSHAATCRPCSQELKNQINSASDKMIKLLSYSSNCPQESSEINNESLSAHERHILNNKNAVNRGCTLAWFFDPSLKSLYYQLNSKTKELENQGYYTFVHGQRWSTYLAEKWFTYLWEIKNHKPCSDYLFMHVNQQLENNDKESQLREEILQNNPKNISIYRPRLLFMNWALFANSFFAASNTACFVAQNSNISPNVISLQKVFAYFDLNNVYAQFKKDFDELEKNHANASKYGNLALIAIPKNLLEKTVYPAESGGYKRQVIIDGKPTDNIRLIMDTLKMHPEKIEHSDGLEFCMPMTSDIALNPESGIKIIPFNAQNNEKTTQINQQEQLLLEKIKQALPNN